MKRILLTGAAGFVGHHVCDHLVANTDWKIVGLDRLTYAGKLSRLAHIPKDRLEFVFHDFRAEFPDSVLRQLGHIDYIIHNGAETHVDNSLREPEVFVQSNVLGTFHVLEAARIIGCQKFVFTSTDEVFGPAPEGISYKENDPVKPTNPYSASKAGAEALCYSYFKSFDVPVIITRTMNVFGERQHPEKFVPLVMRKILRGESVPIHASPEGVSGSRHWIHARNQADAILFLLDVGCPGETYHIAGDERTNFDMANWIANYMGSELKFQFVDANSHRKGHDLRYALSDAKLRGLGWKPHVSFGESLRRTVSWTLRNREWLDD